MVVKISLEIRHACGFYSWWAHNQSIPPSMLNLHHSCRCILPICNPKQWNELTICFILLSAASKYIFCSVFLNFHTFIINKVSIFNSVLMELVTFPLSAKKGRQLFPGWGLFCGVSLAVWQKIKPARNSSKAVLYGNCQYF